MTSDYLWDGTGAVDEDVRALEEKLSTLRYRPSARPLLRRQGLPLRGMAMGVAALAAAAAAALWLGVRTSGDGLVAERRGPEGEHAPGVAASEAQSPGTRSAPPAPLLPGGRSTAGSARPQAGQLPDATSAGGNPDASLRSEDVQKVIASRKHELHRRCFAPARAKSTTDAPDTVRLQTRLKIAKDGQVTSAVTSGSDRGYAGLGECVSSWARGLRFPRSKQGGTVHVPFVFHSSDKGGVIDPFKNAPAPPRGSAPAVNPWGGVKGDVSQEPGSPSTGDPSKRSDGSGVVDPWSQKKTLSSSDVTRVIARERANIGSSCWSSRKANADAPPTARVSVSLSIAPSGAVTRAIAADPPGYPGLGACVANAARRFQFPRAQGPTTVNVPFVFSAN